MKENMKEIVLNLKGGDFKEWYDSLGDDGKKMYKETIKDLSDEYYKDGKGKRYLGHNDPEEN